MNRYKTSNESEQLHPTSRTGRPASKSFTDIRTGRRAYLVYSKLRNAITRHPVSKIGRFTLHTGGRFIHLLQRKGPRKTLQYARMWLVRKTETGEDMGWGRLIYKLVLTLRREGIRGIYRRYRASSAKTILVDTDTIDSRLLLSSLFTLADNRSYAPILSTRYQPKVKVIIPVYSTEKNIHLLSNCIDSLITNTKYDNTEFIIIDDAGPYDSDDLYAKLQKRFTHTTVLKNKRNLGFIGSVNKGLAKVHRDEIAILLNTDVEVPEGWIGRLLTPFAIDPQVASATPMTNSGIITSFPNFCKDNKLFMDLTIQQIDEAFRVSKLDNHFHRTPTGVGYCMALSGKVLDEIGSFDIETFGRGYAEENDWCMRAIQSGYHNVIVDNLFVFHNHGSSFTSKEKKEASEHNLQLLLQKHPNYMNLVDAYVRQDPHKYRRQIVETLLILGHSQVDILFTHKLGGGIESFIMSADNYYRSGEPVRSDHRLIIRPVERNMLLELQDREFQTISKLNMTRKQVDALLQLLDIGNLDIHSLVGYTAVDGIIEVIKRHTEHARHSAFYMHDFFPVSPTINLLSPDTEYRHKIPASELDEFLGTNCFDPDTTGARTHDEWIAMWHALLHAVDDVKTFSESSSDILSFYFPDILPIMREHELPRQLPPARYAEFEAGGPLNIGLLGTIDKHKGSKLVIRMLPHLSPNTKITVIGDSTELRMQKNVNVLGRYKPEDLPKIIEQNKVHCILIPAVWPETFSFTAAEARAMGMPTIVTNIGALPERVSGYEKGLVLQSTEPEKIETQIRDFLSNLDDDN